MSLEDMCFKKVFDSALKSAIRFNHSLDEVLDHADVKDKWAKCQETAEEDAKATAVAPLAGDQQQQVVSLVQGPGALQHSLANKVVTSPVSLSESDEALVDEVEKQCMTKTQALLSTINFAKPPGRGETSETLHSSTSLATALRSIPVIGAQGSADSSVLIMYDIEASGEQAQCPRRSNTPMRKGHLETAVAATLIARSDCTDVNSAAQMITDGEAASLMPDQSDVMLLLGENARVKDIRSRGRAGDTDARSGPEPINFRAMDQSVIEELLHRFRPRIVINLTASCPTAVLPFLLKGLPVVAIGSVVQSVLGHTPEHCKWFKEQAAKMLFETFLRVGSTNYDGRLAKALKIEDAPGPNGNQPVPATGRGVWKRPWPWSRRDEAPKEAKGQGWQRQEEAEEGPGR
ncbi:unnamed protein product [Cladocopium goreaui]|uniref:Uncharacterized protein n=1 Tax=Cladocopium goreaui TaxID=2562237 RepID=A0A9P1BLU6_9DINO|nr:unnamed protein product [Cladocopium goreaui]